MKSRHVPTHDTQARAGSGPADRPTAPPAYRSGDPADREDAGTFAEWLAQILPGVGDGRLTIETAQSLSVNHAAGEDQVIAIRLRSGEAFLVSIENDR